ncbi:MAG: aminotransferase class I/II-fold pyridoxal phosphate-dependent enzyme [Rhodobacteraceae bacterium]|nr:aminotransferase class I/II-fold pyridoxal phosphate-dependent enzyme [Paracoccaceae bacterium]
MKGRISLLSPKRGLEDIGHYMVGISSLPGFNSIIKLSSNESPLGPSPAALAAATAALETAHRYPEVDLQELPEAIAQRYGLEPSQIVFGPGSDEILLRLVSIFSGQGDEVIHSKNAYMQFPIYALRAGSTPIGAEDEDLKHSVDGILACVTERTKIVVVANPDNPSGTYLPGAEIRRLREELRDDILLIIDGAYDEYALADDYENPTNLVREFQNVVVTRTFSKLFCLAGLRLGWCYGPPGVADLMERVGPSFPVNIAAQAAGTEAVRDDAHISAVLVHNTKWIKYLSQELSALGLVVYPSQTNFVLVKFPDKAVKTAKRADDHLKSQGIVGRRFALEDFRDKLRLTVGRDDEMRKTVGALTEFMRR